MLISYQSEPPPLAFLPSVPDAPAFEDGVNRLARRDLYVAIAGAGSTLLPFNLLLLPSGNRPMPPNSNEASDEIQILD